MSLGVPLKLLHESQGLIVTLELRSGHVYRGKLLHIEDNMNCQLRDATCTARDGRTSHLEQCFLRGSQVRFFIVPDNLKHAPFFQKIDPTKPRGVGAGIANLVGPDHPSSGSRGRGGFRGAFRGGRGGGFRGGRGG